MKNKYFLTLLASLISSIMFAQTIQLIMSPNPSPYFSDWQNKTETARLIVNNPSQSSIDCKIKTQVFNGDDELVAETDFAKMPVLTLMPGISQFNAEDIYPLEAVKTYGNYFNTMSATGRIPDGNYRICTDLVDPIKGTPLTTQSPQCKMFRIIAYQEPVLIAPRENQIIPEKETKGIVFRWSPVAPSPNYIVIYRLQVWEVLDGQTNVDAVRYNWPIIEKDLRGILQTQWPVDFAPPEEGMNYVWTITPLDTEERNLVDGYGFADPFGFSIMTESSADQLKQVQVILSQPPPYQLRMTDLSNFTLNNPTENPIEVSLECKMMSRETKPIVIIVIVILKQFTLPPGTTTFTYDDIKNGDIKFSSDKWRDIILNTGSVPSGDYDICVSVIDKEGKVLGKGCVEQKIARNDACKDLSVDFMEERKIFTGDSIAFNCTIVNNYKGNEEQNKPKTFRIKANNDLHMSVSESTSKKWKRTPSKFPPGSTEIVWSASSGEIPGGESNLGSILFTNVKSEPISVQYEWLNKDGKVICSGTSSIRYDVSSAGTTQSIKLISPTNGENITSGKKLDFTWMPVLPEPQEPLTYRLTVWQLMQGQTGTQAMRVNQPIFTKDVKNTSVVWFTLTDADTPLEIAFVWTVQALNREGKPIGENNGTMADAFMFTIDKPIVEAETIIPQLISPADGSLVDASQPVLFTWTAKSNNPAARNTYSLKVVEIIGRQSPDDAVKRNPTWYQSNELRTTMLQYPFSARKLEAEKKYAWTVQIINKETQVASETGTMADAFMFTIKETEHQTYQPPKLLAPIDGVELSESDLKKPMTFRWMLVLPKPQEPVTYRLKVWQLMQGQTATQAMHVNQPIITKDVENMTQAVVNNIVDGPCKLPYLCDFVWNVQALNREGKPIGENNGMSEPGGYRIEGHLGTDYKESKVSVKLQQPPPNQLRMTDLSNFTLNNPIGKPIEVSLECKMTSQETKPILIIVIIILKPFTLPPGITKFSDITLKRGTIKYATEEWEHAFSPTGVIPTDDYEICVSALDKEGKEIGKDCAEQKISTLDMTDLGATRIKLISPKNGETVISEKELQFIWLPPVPVPPDTRCRLKIVEIKGEESPEEAMQNSESFFDVWVELPDQEGEVIYKYPESAPKFEKGKKYAWMVKLGELSSGISIYDRWGTKSTTLKCECGNWSPIEINKVRYDCGGRMDWKCNERINFSGSYQCSPNDTTCQAKTSWEITKDGSDFNYGSGSSGSFTPTSNGTYILTISASCNGIECSPCTTTFIVNDCLSCDCGNWSPIEINKIRYDCGGRMDWKCNEPINFSNTYQCNPNTEKCKAETSWEIARNGQPIQAGSGSADSYTPTSNGFYTLSLNAYCNGIECEPCIYTFVVDGCPECDCGKWGNNQIVVSINDKPQKPIICGQELDVDLNAQLTLTFPNYFCQPSDCAAKYTWDLLDVTNSIHIIGISNSFNYNFNVPGTYTLSFNAYCGGEIACDSCIVFINVDDNCGCSDRWNQLVVNKKKLDCGGKMAWKCNQAINFSNTFLCNPNNERCMAETSWEISKDGSVINSGSGSVDSFTPTSNGNYTLRLNANCNGIKCEPCIYTFVVEGCPDCTCKEKNWDVIQNITYHTDNGGTSQSIECLSTLKNKIIAGSIFEYATTPYNCLKEKCKAEYKWEIINVSSGVVHSSGTALSFPINFTAPTSAGDYQLVVTPICGNTICGSCGFYFSTSLCSQSALPAPTANPGTGIQETQFTANWTAVAGATGYFIDVSTNPAFASYVGGYQNLNIGIANSFVVTGLNCNTSYFYRIRAIDDCNEISSNSNYMRVNTPIPSLSVTAIAATGILPTQFNANWNAVPAASYYIDVSTNPNFSSYINGYWNLSVGTATSINISFLNCNTTYYYRIRAVGECGGPSGNSNIITVMTPTPIQAPPIATAATQTATWQFMAHWTAVNGASGYFFDLSTDADFSSFVPNGNNVDAGLSTQFNLLGGIWCTTYYYRVRAVNACGGISINSNTIAVNISPQNPHGSWIQGPGDYSFNIGAYGTTAEIQACPGKSIPLTIEVWGAGGGGGSGHAGVGGCGGHGCGGGGGGGYAKTTINVIVPTTPGVVKKLYVHVGSGGIGGALYKNSGGMGGVSNVKEQYNVYYTISASGGLGAQYANFYGSLGGAGGSGSINNWSGSSGTNGAIVNAGCNGGAGGLGGAGGGPGRTGPGYFNDGGNGGHGGYLHNLINPTCTEHGQDYLLSAGAAGGNGRVKISW